MHGITTDNLPYLQSIPELARDLPEPFNSDEAAAAHQNLFGFNIFPNASIFLDPSRLLGGEIANRHAELYHQVNFLADSAVDPDHISQSLAFLSHLASLEANQSRSGQPPLVPQSHQHKFLESYFLPWLIPFTIAVELQDNPFYNTLVRLTRSLAADHYESINLSHLNVVNQAGIQAETLAAPPSLEDGRTGLNQIARFLITPILSGLYIGRSSINQMARRLNLPHGFGRRDQMLQTLIESAGQYDSIPQLFTVFHDLLTSWQQAYQQISHDHAQLNHHISPWQSRLRQTGTLLSQMEKQV